ncbi:hypothetical protein [Fibrobacter sp.]|uniref:hypothetical protein n=1 Tax=Fibrobacter sp. TaxID=35828 RepID=UPI00388D057A
MKAFLIMLVPIAILILVYALSWAVTCGLYYLITLCFGLTFNWLIATGVWLVLVILKNIFGK